MLSGARNLSHSPSPRGSVLGVIPARLAATRLPRKPLISVAGRTLIEWVWRRMSLVEGLGELVVAADDAEVVRAVEAFGGQAVMTRVDHRSGTDRVAEVAGRTEYRHYEYVVNLQGDEPFLPTGAAEGAVELVRSGWEVGTAAVAIGSASEWRDPSVVKVVTAEDGGALYFSRAPIPYDHRAGRGEGAVDRLGALRHVGIYAFTRATLERAASLPANALELREGLEQLRWLAAGAQIGVSLVEGGEPGIDTEEDVKRAEMILGERHRRHE